MRLSRWLVVAIAGAALALPATAGAEVLYDQTDNAGELPMFGSMHPNFAPSTYQDENSFSRVADDFTVPVGEVWTIEEVEAPGYGEGSASGFNVLLYPDAGGVPGAPLFEQHEIPLGGCICPTGAPLLPAGKYWVTVQLSQDPGGIPWSWRTRTQQTGAPAQYMAKVPGCTSADGPWARRAGCSPSENPDQIFKLSGTKSAPSSDFDLGALTLDKKKGTATQTIAVPGTGSVTLTGKDLASQSAAPSAAGDVALTIKPKGKLKKKLRKNGKVTVNAAVSFTPTGGTAKSQDVAVELKRKAKKKG